MNEFISTKAASEKLGLSIRRVQALITSGRLPAEKIGNSYVVREQNLKLVKDRPTGRPAKRAENKNDAKKPFKNIFDIESELAETLAGSSDSGLGDLSSNKKYMEGFGTEEGKSRNGNEKMFKTAFDIAPGLMSRLLDKQRDLPSDLSTNKERLKDLGKKAAEKKALPKENDKPNNA